MIEEKGDGRAVQQRIQARIKVAADATRITDENAGNENHKHTSGGKGAVIDEDEGEATSIPGNEGRIAQAWVNVTGGMRVFAVYFWHSEV